MVHKSPSLRYTKTPSYFDPRYTKAPPLRYTKAPPIVIQGTQKPLPPKIRVKGIGSFAIFYS